MNWQADISAELPPTGDEPSSLRRDICDELADHLTCAADRESAEEEDEERIRERVLERFGNPARIARQLWFDAIKGKLMLQKFATGFAAVAAVAAIAGCVILWVAVASGREAVNQALEEQRRDREQNAKANAALLAKLEKLAEEAKQPAKSMEWNPLKFKLLLGEEGNEPAVGYQAWLDGRPYGGEKESTIQLQRKSNENGMVDFGLVRPGAYFVTVATPSNFKRQIHVTVTPGQVAAITVRCPREQPVKTNVKLQVDLPKDLLDRKVAVLIELFRPRLTVGSTSWSSTSGGRMLLASGKDSAEPYLGSTNYGRVSNSLFHGKIQLVSYEDAGRKPSAWLTAEYRVRAIQVILKDDATSNNRRRQLWWIVAAARYDELGREGEESQSFKPQAGKENVWTTQLPHKLLKQVRQRFKKLDEMKTATPLEQLTTSEQQRYLTLLVDYFTYLDRRGNGDGKLQEREWDVSNRIKPIFLKAKVDLQKDMTMAEFQRHYIRLIGVDDPTWKRMHSPGRSSSSPGNPPPRP